MKNNVDYYINEDGRYVFTKHYLQRRGFCCKNGCLHCPYGFKKMKLTRKQVEEQVKKYYDQASRGQIVALIAIFLLPGGVFILSYIFYKKYKDQIKQLLASDIEVTIERKEKNEYKKDK